MRKWLLLLMVGAGLNGCAATPAPNLWDDIEVPTGAAVTPLDCGQFPLPTIFNDAGASYDKAGVNLLEAYRVCAETNAEAGVANAEQIEFLRLAATDLVVAGQHQRHIADMRLEMLEDERRHNFWTSVGYWVVIVALGYAASD